MYCRPLRFLCLSAIIISFHNSCSRRLFNETKRIFFCAAIFFQHCIRQKLQGSRSSHGGCRCQAALGTGPWRKTDHTQLNLVTLVEAPPLLQHMGLRPCEFVSSVVVATRYSVFCMACEATFRVSHRAFSKSAFFHSGAVLEF